MYIPRLTGVVWPTEKEKVAEREADLKSYRENVAEERKGWLARAAAREASEKKGR